MAPTPETDPFAIFLTPPPNETPGERTAREAREAEAKRISDEIDDQLRQEKAALKKRQNVVKVLLLGQSESGKSTTLKNFRMKYARHDWESERASWRAVIQLNLVRSIITIIETLQAELDGEEPSSLDGLMTPMTPHTPSTPLAAFPLPQSPATAQPSTSSYPPLPEPEPTPATPGPWTPTIANSNGSAGPGMMTYSDDEPVSPAVSTSISTAFTFPTKPHGSGTTTSNKPTLDTSMLSRSTISKPLKAPLSSLLTEHHHQLMKHRLFPLRRVEAQLRARLGTGADEDFDGAAAGYGVLDSYAEDQAGGSRTDDMSGSNNTNPGDAHHDPSNTNHPSGSTTVGLAPQHKGPRREFSVRRLKDALENGKRTSRSSLRGGANKPGPSSPGSSASEDEQGHSVNGGGGPDLDPVTSVIVDCKDDMLALWTDETVRVILKRRKVRMEESSGFFLDDLERIASHAYEPSDDDILRARLRTVGVQEYKIYFENESLFNDYGREWLLYDVGGSRTMRHVWIPFFEGITSILFMAPVSCFDERLSEDSRINRLEDSFLLWRTICGSKLLAKTSIILFLNKCDLLKRKLKAGVKVRNYLPSFGERSNDVNTVIKYLREKFKEILKQYTPEPRSSYFYATSVVDTRATSTTIKAVKDSILRDFLKSADLV